MKTTINPITFDLINDKVEILIGGLRNKWISGEQYRTLRRLAQRFTSGLRRVRRYDFNTYQTTLYFNTDNVVRHIAYSGNAECAMIQSIIC